MMWLWYLLTRLTCLVLRSEFLSCYFTHFCVNLRYVRPQDEAEIVWVWCILLMCCCCLGDGTGVVWDDCTKRLAAPWRCAGAQCWTLTYGGATLWSWSANWWSCTHFYSVSSVHVRKNTKPLIVNFVIVAVMVFIGTIVANFFWWHNFWLISGFFYCI